MRLLIAAVVATFTIGIVSAEAGTMPAGTPGQEGFEAALEAMLQNDSAQVQSDLLNDPTTAGLATAETNVSPQEEAPREEVSIDGIRGVPGDPTFEDQLAAWLEQDSQMPQRELSRDPTAAGLTR